MSMYWCGIYFTSTQSYSTHWTSEGNRSALIDSTQQLYDLFIFYLCGSAGSFVMSDKHLDDVSRVISARA